MNNNNNPLAQHTACGRVCVCDSAKLQAQHQATVTIFLHRKSDFFPNTKKLENCIIIIVVVELSTALSTAVLLSIVVALLTGGAYILSTDYSHLKVLNILDSMPK